MHNKHLHIHFDLNVYIRPTIYIKLHANIINIKTIFFINIYVFGWFIISIV